MKRSGPPERRTPLTADPGKVQAWQQRTAAAAVQRGRDRAAKNIRADVTPRDLPGEPRITTRSSRPRRNDAPWRAECLQLRGERCRACGTTRDLQVDHIMPRAQGGPSVVQNGLVLCEPHHTAKTDSRIVIQPSWLDPDQVAWLAAADWVRWDADGEPAGRGWRHFAPDRRGR